jgi:hypothetical protein
VEPEARSKKQEAGSQKQEARSKKPEVRRILTFFIPSWSLIAHYLSKIA